MKTLPLLILLTILFSCKNEKAESTDSIDIISLENKTLNLRDLIGNDFLIDNQHSYLGFKIKYFGFSPVRGRFDDFDGTLFYDGLNINNLSTSVSVNVSSINTGNDRRDNDLKSEDSWFNMTDFPIISFKSTKVVPKENGRFDLIGNLTIKGTTLSDTISFNKPTELSKDWAGNDQIDFSGRMEINRQDYKVFGGDFWSSIMENGLTQLSDEVEIEIDIHCRKADYQFRYDTADSLDINKKIVLQIKENGIDQGLININNLHNDGNLTAGKLSSIGYTLNTWGLYEQATIVFKKRLELFPNLNTTWNQLGITNLHLNKLEEAMKCFKNVLEKNPDDSRALEYIRLIEKINTVN